MGKAPTTPLPQAFYFEKVLLIFFFLFGSIITGSRNFLFSLTDVFQVLIGEDLNRTSKMVSIGSFSVCCTSLESFKRRFCYRFFNYSTFPTGRVILISFKVIFFSWVEPFLGANVVFRSLFCFGSSLSLNSTFDNIPIFTNRSSSLFISSVAANGTFRFFLKMGRVFFLQFKFCLNFSIFAKTS